MPGTGEQLQPLLPKPVKRLDEPLAVGIVWTAGADWSSQIISWACLLVVVRLLTPADFGLVAMAVIVFSYLSRVGTFGIPHAIVTMRDLTDHQLAQLNTLSLMMGVAGFAVACALAYPLGWFFRSPQLPKVFIVTCLGLLMMGLRNVSDGLLQKGMRFKRLAAFETAHTVTAGVVTLALAALGFGYWALVLGHLAGTAARTACMLSLRRHGYAWLQFQTIKPALKFSRHVLVSYLASDTYSRADNAIAGRVLGPSALGFYSVAWNLANIPLERVTSLITVVVGTFFGVVREDYTSLRRYLCNLTQGIALITFPATIGLALIARELIPFAMGTKWTGVVVPLELLAFYAAIQSIVALMPKVLMAIGQTRFWMWMELVALLILPPAFYIGSHWGTAGIALGWAAIYPFIAAVVYWKTFKRIELSFLQYYSALRPAVEGSAAMAILVLAAKWFQPAAWPLIVRLSIEIFSGAAAYILVILVFHRRRAMAFLRLAKTVRHPSGP